MSSGWALIASGAEPPYLQDPQRAATACGVLQIDQPHVDGRERVIRALVLNHQVVRTQLALPPPPVPRCELSFGGNSNASARKGNNKNCVHHGLVVQITLFRHPQPPPPEARCPFSMVRRCSDTCSNLPPPPRRSEKAKLTALRTKRDIPCCIPHPRTHAPPHLERGIGAGVQVHVGGVSGAASRQLVVPHRWGTRLGVCLRPLAQTDPPREGEAGQMLRSHCGPSASILTVKTTMRRWCACGTSATR